jgi:hypothetical protein
MVTDVKAAMEHPMVLFRSLDPRHPLYDFMYRSNDDTFHAFQATIGKTHTANQKKLGELRTKLGTSPLVFYYLVPEERFEDFAITPVDPSDGLANTVIWHVSVPKPK